MEGRNENGRPALRYWLLGTGFALALLAPAGAKALRASGRTEARQPVVVYETERAFSQASVSLHAGQTLMVENRNGGMHHIYVENPRFRHDGGEQNPGTSVAIPFDSTGSFAVLCGIHPRMRLDVEVR